MDHANLIALCAYAFVTSVTPGPNNLMLMASGVNFGLVRTIPHAIGVAVGFSIMIALVGVGLIGLFDQFPLLHLILKLLSVVYLLWLAWKIANSGSPDQSGTVRAKPMSFIQAVLFQWVNPKAWSMALSGVALYAPDRSVSAVLLFAVVFGAVNFPSTGMWAVIGKILNKYLANPVRLKVFNWTMAALLVASLAMLI